MAKKATRKATRTVSLFLENLASDILQLWKKPAGAFIQIGKKLLEAEAASTRADFVAWIGRPGEQGRVPFSYDTARRLMAIGADKRLARFAHGQRALPASWRTLYEITRLTDEQFKLAVEQDLIDGETERSTIEHIRQGVYDKPDQEPEEAEEPLPPLPPTQLIHFKRGPARSFPLGLVGTSQSPQNRPALQSPWHRPAKQSHVYGVAAVRSEDAIEDCVRAIRTAVDEALYRVDDAHRAELSARAHRAIDDKINLGKADPA